MVCTYKYLDENQYVTYLIHWFSLRASCYRIPNLAAAQSHGNALQEGATVSPSSAFSLRKSMAWIRRLQACNHLVYLSAKFGVLNQRINEIRSSENQWWPLGPTPSVTDSQICKTTHSESLSGCVTWLQCFLWHHGPLWTTVYMPPLSCMQLDASCPLEIKQPQPHTWEREFSLKKMFHGSCFCQLSSLGQ